MKPSKQMKRQSEVMKIIGITGGIGSGKTEVLTYIQNKYNCEIIIADEVAHRVKEPGEKCYGELTALLGKEILSADGQIDRVKMAEKIFGDEAVLLKVNQLIHPAVKDYILKKIAEAACRKIDFLFIEAALLIEDGYTDIADELWYIFAEEETRRKRLREHRNYSDEKITGILSRQLSEEEYKKHCRVLINNGGNIEETYQQIDGKLEEYL